MAALRIEYFVHGRGRGHASRALSVLPALSRLGVEVRVFASGQALPMLEGASPRALVRPSALAAWQLARQATRDALGWRSDPPALVIADGDQSALLAGRALGLPTLAIGHDLVFAAGDLPSNLPKTSLWHQRLNVWPAWRSATRAVGVHFLPIASTHPRLRVARPELEPSADAAGGLPASGEGSDQRGPIVCYFRDDNGAAIASALARRGEAFVLHGGAAGSITRAAFRTALATSRAVITSAGSNLLAECVLLGRPVLALYRSGDHEQRLNAALVEQAGVGAACTLEQVTDAALDHFLTRVSRGTFRQVALGSLAPVSEVVAQETEYLLRANGHWRRDSEPAVDPVHPRPPM